MSAPMVLTSDQLHDFARALEALTKIRCDHEVDVAAYGGTTEVRVGDDTVIAIRWDEERGEYVVDDRNGR